MRFVLNLEVEYTPNPDNYPEGSTPEEMLEIDRANAQKDPSLFFQGATRWPRCEVTGTALLDLCIECGTEVKPHTLFCSDGCAQEYQGMRDGY